MTEESPTTYDAEQRIRQMQYECWKETKMIENPQMTPMEDLARNCADNLANMICDNGWLDFSKLMRVAMADKIIKYLNKANMMSKDTKVQADYMRKK